MIPRNSCSKSKVILFDPGESSLFPFPRKAYNIKMRGQSDSYLQCFKLNSKIVSIKKNEIYACVHACRSTV